MFSLVKAIKKVTISSLSSRIFIPPFNSLALSLHFLCYFSTFTTPLLTPPLSKNLTNSHSYPDICFSHPKHPEHFIRSSQSLCLYRLCGENHDFETQSQDKTRQFIHREFILARDTKISFEGRYVRRNDVLHHDRRNIFIY